VGGSEGCGVCVDWGSWGGRAVCHRTETGQVRQSQADTTDWGSLQGLWSGCGLAVVWLWSGCGLPVVWLWTLLWMLTEPGLGGESALCAADF
jgi:hypothetical protein